MPTFRKQLHEWRIVLAILAAAAGCVLLGTGSLGRSSLEGRGPLPERPVQPAPQWFPALFSARSTPAPEQARARLEQAGLALDGSSFVKAIALGHKPLIDLFFAAGIDPDARAEGGRTALMVTAAAGSRMLMTELLGKGASPNLADDGGVTPLMFAAAANRPAAVDLLLEHGAQTEAVDAEGRTAAACAIAGRNLVSFPKLLGPGGDDTELLDAAFAAGDWHFIEPVLNRQTEPLEWSAAARAALLQALDGRDEARTRLLLGKYAGAPTPENSAQPLLAWMVRDDQLERFKFLLQCGADPDALINSPVEKAFAAGLDREPTRSYLVSEPGMTTLMLAAGLAKPEFVRALLASGAKRGLVTTRYKLPALTFAAETNEFAALQLLISDAPPPEQMRIVISLGEQRATVLRYGQSVLSTQVSTGRPGFATPSGDFVITDKHLVHKSTIYKADMPFFMRLNCRDFGMHEGVVPGHPASHGCIRLPGEIARRLFKEIPVGTLVSIRQ